MNAREQWRSMSPGETVMKNMIGQARSLLAKRGAMENPPPLEYLIAEECYVAKAEGAWYAAERIRSSAEYLTMVLKEIDEAVKGVKDSDGVVG
ncbi:MAG: hypothetical protein ABH877_02710 [bacterium]